MLAAGKAIFFERLLLPLCLLGHFLVLASHLQQGRPPKSTPLLLANWPEPALTTIIASFTSNDHIFFCGYPSTSRQFYGQPVTRLYRSPPYTSSPSSTILIATGSGCRCHFSVTGTTSSVKPIFPLQPCSCPSFSRAWPLSWPTHIHVYICDPSTGQTLSHPTDSSQPKQLTLTELTRPNSIQLANLFWAIFQPAFIHFSSVYIILRLSTLV